MAFAFIIIIIIIIIISNNDNDDDDANIYLSIFYCVNNYSNQYCLTLKTRI